MNHNFSHDELNLLCVNLASTRKDAILNLDVELLEIEDPEMSALCFSAIEKLKLLDDPEYIELCDTLFPDFDFRKQ